MKTSKEVQQDTKPSFLSGSFPGGLEKRNIIRSSELVTALVQCKIEKDGTVLPSPELALRRASASGKIEIVKILVRLVKDMDINQVGLSGKTAIMFAKEYNKTEVVEFLKSIGARFESDEPTANYKQPSIVEKKKNRCGRILRCIFQ